MQRKKNLLSTSHDFNMIQYVYQKITVDGSEIRLTSWYGEYPEISWNFILITGGFVFFPDSSSVNVVSPAYHHSTHLAFAYRVSTPLLGWHGAFQVGPQGRERLRARPALEFLIRIASKKKHRNGWKPPKKWKAFWKMRGVFDVTFFDFFVCLFDFGDVRETMVVMFMGVAPNDCYQEQCSWADWIQSV